MQQKRYTYFSIKITAEDKTMPFKVKSYESIL